MAISVVHSCLSSIAHIHKPESESEREKQRMTITDIIFLTSDNYRLHSCEFELFVIKNSRKSKKVQQIGK